MPSRNTTITGPLMMRSNFQLYYRFFLCIHYFCLFMGMLGIRQNMHFCQALNFGKIWNVLSFSLKYTMKIDMYYLMNIQK
jgi:hypothetical protein